MGVDEATLRRVLREVAQERARLRHGPSLDGARMAREIERQPPGPGMPPHQALANRRPFLALGLGEIGEAENAAREYLAM